MLPVMRPTSIETAQEKQDQDNDLNRALLKTMRENPAGTQAEWAMAIGRAKGG